jgi:hypothetical protein
MNLAIMQPYFFPYIGYFHLMEVVDKFIIYDDVNFIKGGWVNRNRILVQNQSGFINMPIIGASSFKKINEISIGENVDSVLNKIRNSYSKAPFFNLVFPLIIDLINYKTNNLSLHLSHSIIELANYLDINTSFILSSNIVKDNTLKGQDKVISICKIMQAKSYYNTVGGVSLYSKETFEKNNIELKFVQSDNIEYLQFNNQFIPNLSILDVLMFNGKDGTKNYLDKYQLF